ncbi:integrase arm-type DNA-binding domain-containing protein [Acaryochloris sp. IP29b_bin.137]|uniref:tyrosine-type recombinase/integrase n=1 Tax=Acaryochloris sp. IP29b_bin.137 TaxID=2969217 RepID=UPI0026193D19|nr:integrase arm-type DNA-binding domain-containing protein [Acaryochloris sp. IP29b_bin.137]
MRTPNKLSDIQIRNAKPKDKNYKLSDGGGLFLLITKAGGKLWRYKYRFEGREKLLSLGGYPDIGLKEARESHHEARKLLASGIDPCEHRKAQKQSAALRSANSFEVIAREWFSRYSQNWAVSHSKTVTRRLEKDIFPWMGDRPISEITAPELLTVIRQVEERGALETAHRELNICGQVFRYAIATGRAERDPSGDLRGALPPVKSKHLAAITDPKRVGELMRMIYGYEGSLIVKCALKLAPLVFVRPGELRQALWQDFDWDKKEWRFTVTKTHTEHIVPLSRQSVSILKEIQYLTGRGEFVFPSGRTPLRPMSNNAILAALRSLGIPKSEMSGHGFRAMARTLLDEELKVRPDLVEHQLAHAVKDPLGRAYNRTQFLEERHQMMQQWADYLDKLRTDV